MNTIPLPDLIKLVYPSAKLFPANDWNVLIGDLNDGNGCFIEDWKITDVIQPTFEELNTLQTQYSSQYINSQFQSQGTIAIQNLLDTTAQSKQYTDALSCISYATSTNTTWQQEAIVFIAWRDAIYASAIAMFTQIESAAIQAPTIEQFLSGLPKLTWS